MLHRTAAVTETMPLVLWLLLLLSVTSSQSISKQSDPLSNIFSAEFSPKDPLFASGSTMQLNGTLIRNNATLGVTAHQVRCTFDSANLTVVVLDDNTFQIIRENVTRQGMSLGHIFCYLTVMGKSVQFAQVVIRVADIPVAPNITSCIVDNWETMNCTWELQPDTGIPTNYTLGWTVLGDKVLHPCDCVDGNTCLWDISEKCHFKMDMLYHLKMVAENDLKSVTSQNFTDFNTTNLVKPHPVWDLRSIDITSQSVELRWNWGSDSHSDQTRSLRYRVNYTSIWDRKSIETTSNSTILSGLIPYTEYRISVECFPYASKDRKGIWSKETVIPSLFTKEDVPGRAPAFADGGYHSSATNNAELTVYWQHVPQRWQHGRLKQYHIQCFVYGNESDILAEEFINQTFSTFKVQHREHPYLAVTIEAETTIGYNNSLDLKTLVIPRPDLAPAKPRIVHAVRNQSEMTVMWSSVYNVSGYTVYWCKLVPHSEKCEIYFNWISVSPDVTSLQISIGSVREEKFQVAVSVEMYIAELKQNVSSGMIFAGCVPDIAKDVQPPKSVDFAKEQQAYSLTVEWVKPNCEDTAYIVKFEILYCQLQGCGEDVCCNNKSMFVENNETLKLEMKAIIRDLTADVVYQVSMRSISFTQNSTDTKPMQHIVHRSGLTAGVIAAIVIVAIILFLLLVVGLVTIAKKVKKCFYCCDPIKIEPPTKRVLSEQIGSNPVQYYRGGNDIPVESEEQRSLIHDGTTDKLETDAVIIRRNGQDYHHPNTTKSFLPLAGENGMRLLGPDELADSGVLQSHDSSISSYTHLAVPDEGARAPNREPDSFVEIGHNANRSSDHTSHILPSIAANHLPTQTLDAAEPPASGSGTVINVTEPYMPVEKISLPVGSATSSTITPYTTVEQTFEMAEPRHLTESRECCLPTNTNDDAIRQVEAPAVDCHSIKPDDYQQVQSPIDDYISGSLAGVSNIPGEPPINTVNNAELVGEVEPLYANHDMPENEDGYSDQRDVTVETSSLKPLLPVGYIPLAPTLST